VTYLSLRVGPWAISKDNLEPLRDVEASASGRESILDFSERYPARERTREMPKPQPSPTADATRPLSDTEPPHEPM
ncbi:MAG: hypothetical protein ACO38D_09425, partial [Ilumatobacteraceae bacterium]